VVSMCRAAGLVGMGLVLWFGSVRAEMRMDGPSGYHELSLTWNAVGDDSSAGGNATVYDVRYSTVPINDSTWALATQLSDEPTPAEPDSAETFLVEGLQPGHRYYFALKVADEVPNWSPLSNIVLGATMVLDTGTSSLINTATFRTQCRVPRITITMAGPILRCSIMPRSPGESTSLPMTMVCGTSSMRVTADQPNYR